MIVKRYTSPRQLIKWSGHHIIWLLLFVTSIACLYRFEIINIALPWLPISIIGTAVAFYVGFKNNSAYDRMWEARKIWGAIINSSRSFGMQVDSFVSNQFTTDDKSKEELHEIKQKLIYRHLGWLYALRSQLLVPTPWEHVMSQGKHMQKLANYYRDNYGVGLVADEVTRTELNLFLPKEEHDRLINHANTATQIINEQSRNLKVLREQNIIEDFRHIELSKTLSDMYIHQGKCERIKKFPLPRQYANLSRIFVIIFIALLPFGMIPELMETGEFGFWLSIPITALIGWIFVMMEIVGDYTENPFQGMANDIPMLSLCRVIEIDLREMLGETDLPPAIEAKNGVLM